jgi:tetratricopeptide (TPR) repeat protein
MENNFTNNDELLMAYLDSEMTESQKSNFESQLAADPELMLRLNNLLYAREAIHQYGIKQQVAVLHAEMMQQLQPPVRSISPLKKIYRLTAVAAAAILLFVTGYWFLHNQPVSAETIYSDNYTVYEMPITRGGTELSAMEDAYQNKNFALVLTLANKTVVMEPSGLFLAGAAAMEIKEFDKAITNFNSLLQNNKSTNSVSYNDEAEYYLALAYLKKDNYKEAFHLFAKINANKEHTFHAKATDKLLAKIKKLLKN